MVTISAPGVAKARQIRLTVDIPSHSKRLDLFCTDDEHLVKLDKRLRKDLVSTGVELSETMNFRCPERENNSWLDQQQPVSVYQTYVCISSRFLRKFEYELRFQHLALFSALSMVYYRSAQPFDNHGPLYFAYNVCSLRCYKMVLTLAFKNVYA